MHWTLQLAGSFVLIGIAVAMILFEQARLRTNPPFPVTEGGRVFYWMTYLSLIVLGAAFGLAALIH